MSIREMKEQDLQQLRAVQEANQANGVPPDGVLTRSAVRRASALKLREAPQSALAKSKAAAMFQECLQIASCRLVESSSKVRDKLSKSLPSRSKSMWPDGVAPLLTRPSGQMEPGKNTKMSTAPQWMSIRLDSQVRDRPEPGKDQLQSNNPEVLHMAFQQALEEAKRIQAQVVAAKNEVQRLQGAVALQAKELAKTTPKAERPKATAPHTARTRGHAALTLPSIK